MCPIDHFKRLEQIFSSVRTQRDVSDTSDLPRLFKNCQVIAHWGPSLATGVRRLTQSLSYSASYTGELPCAYAVKSVTLR